MTEKKGGIPNERDEWLKFLKRRDIILRDPDKLWNIEATKITNPLPNWQMDYTPDGKWKIGWDGECMYKCTDLTSIHLGLTHMIFAFNKNYSQVDIVSEAYITYRVIFGSVNINGQILTPDSGVLNIEKGKTINFTQNGETSVLSVMLYSEHAPKFDHHATDALITNLRKDYIHQQKKEHGKSTD